VNKTESLSAMSYARSAAVIRLYTSKLAGLVAYVVTVLRRSGHVVDALKFHITKQNDCGHIVNTNCHQTV